MSLRTKYGASDKKHYVNRIKAPECALDGYAGYGQSTITVNMGTSHILFKGQDMAEMIKSFNDPNLKLYYPKERKGFALVRLASGELAVIGREHARYLQHMLEVTILQER